MKTYVVAQLNARLQPMHRGEYFEDPLDIELKSAACGEVSGGGSLQSKIGEIEHCDIEIEVSGPLSIAVRVVIETLEALGAPKGSKLHLEVEGKQVQFGQAEGMAVYLNGTDLPDDVYKECDSNFVYSEFDRLLSGKGRVLSYWQGPTETAFYMYGHSFQEMRVCLTEFLASYPLCHQCRVEQIA